MDADSQSSGQTLPPDQVAFAVEVFRMLADGTRIQILWALIDREMPVNEIAETIGKPGTSVSQHPSGFGGSSAGTDGAGGAAEPVAHSGQAAFAGDSPPTGHVTSGSAAVGSHGG